MVLMKLRVLQSCLEDVDDFEDPKLQLEQYLTSPHVAAHMLYTIELEYGDVEGMTVLDLGCGTGMLSIASSLLGASYCLGVDVDEEALGIFKQNLDDVELSNVDLLQCNVTQLKQLLNSRNKFDTAIMNPPFGTKHIKNLDIAFVKTAMSLCSRAVYSLHKSTHLRSIEREMKKAGVKTETITQVSFELPNTYKNHREKSVDINVVLLRFTK